MTCSRIAVGVDFSPESQRALDHAMAIARHTGAAITLIHVGAVPEPGPSEPWRDALLERRARRLPERRRRHDFSPYADRALERALEITAPGGEVRVVYAWSAPYLAYDLDGRVLAAPRDTAEAEIERQRPRILGFPTPPDVTLRLELADGAPFSVLDTRSDDADLVAVGRHGHRGVRRLLLGSVAEATIRHARCSVLVAR